MERNFPIAGLPVTTWIIVLWLIFHCISIYDADAATERKREELHLARMELCGEISILAADDLELFGLKNRPHLRLVKQHRQVVIAPRGSLIHHSLT